VKQTPLNRARGKPVIVLGAGRVGALAVERLRAAGFSRLTVVDRNPSALARLTGEARTTPGEAVDWLTGQELGRAWIVPAVPAHLAFQWLGAVLGAKGIETWPLTLDRGVFEGLPHLAATVAGGGLVASWADFICPPDCDERGPCPLLGRELEPPYLMLRRMADALPLTVVRSYPLAPGLGGYPTRSLTWLLSQAGQGPGKKMVATACRCHAVIHAFELAGKGGQSD